ncbi:MAG: protein-glutamate O-methyltransferase CheR [Nitrospirae bacterium]|nr:protein-glutamate O-methyltransferase CheR [Nitrospirota bacterium]MBF0590628.1 protein-glutamate O-methyltransferase CheR [Nitrospirota bacterium]
MMVLKDETFKDLRDFIYDNTGIYIPDTKKYFIENRLSKRLEEKKIGSYEDYFYLLKYNTDKNELKVLYDKITTNETFFFRELQQLEVLVQQVIPRIKEERKIQTVKIWSAACSTGEEPYTIAMMLMDNPKTCSLRLDMVASDISDVVIERAQQATYGQYSLRNIPEQYMKKYFKQGAGTNYTLNSDVRTKVKFMQLNLLDDKKIRGFREMDVIFCRNVLIYFDKKAKLKVVTNLYESMKTGGYLFIGMAESLHDITRLLRPQILGKTVVYQKA